MSDPIPPAEPARQPPAAHIVDVTVADDRWSRAITGVEAVCRAAAGAALAGHVGPVEVAILLADDARLRSLNQTFRGIDRPTNVLSFPAHQPGAAPPVVPGHLLGDIAIAFQTTRDEAADQAIKFAHHLTHLVVHGTLHLLGHDHQTDADAQVMEARERDLLAGLGVPDPYKETVPS